MTQSVTVDPVEIGPANLQNYQDIYKQLTGRSEARVTFQKERHRITMEHIQALHQDIQRTAHLMTLISSSMEITQRSEDDTHERWSGMEKFRAQGPEITQITTDVELVYNMLIKLPHAENPGIYKIKIGLRNELYNLKEHRKNDSELSEVKFIMMSQMATARWEVEFTDMSVARTFSRVISDWYDRLPKHPVPAAEKLSEHSKAYIAPTVRLLSSIIVAISAFGSAVWTGEPLASGRIALFIIMMYVVHFLTSPLIARLKHKMMCIRTAASLAITSSDRELLDDEEKSRGQLARWIWGNALLPQLPAGVFFALNYLRSYF
jgi:hypothetical protein